MESAAVRNPQLPLEESGVLELRADTRLPVAIRFVAKIRPTAHHPSRPDRRTHRVIPRGSAIVLRQEKIPAPFPDVPGHFIETEPVRRERLRGGTANMTVICRVQAGKGSLPDVALVLPVRCQLIPPCIALPVQTAPGGILLLGFAGQPPIRPPAVGQGIVMRDVNHRMVADRGPM